MSNRLDDAKIKRKKLFGAFTSLQPERILDHGKGIYLFDQNGNPFIDFCSSPLAAGLGHGDQRIRNAAVEQMDKVSVCLNTFWINEREGELAERILNRAPKNMTCCQFQNSGSEAVETAIKLAHQYHAERGKPEKHKVISRWQSYHGMTIAALSLTGFTFCRDKFGLLLHSWPKIDSPLCYRCPYELSYPACEVLCAKILEHIINQVGEKYISAFIAEPIGGATSGATVPVPEYYAIIREICDKHDVLFIDDEVICGFGRTGKWFGIDHWKVQPDIIIMAKGISSVYTPLAAVLIDERIARTFEKNKAHFIHGYTTAGNPVSCSIGLEVIDIIEKEGLVERSATMGDYLNEKAKQKLLPHPTVGDIRGKGMLMGVELVKNKETKEPFNADIQASYQVHLLAMDRGCMVFPRTGIIQGVKGDQIMIAPPLIITESEIDKALDILDSSLSEFEKQIL